MDGGLRRLRDLVDAAPDPTLVVDPDGRIVMINQELEDAFGFEQSELLGAQVERLVPARFATTHRRSCGRTFDRPTHRRMGYGLDVFALHKTGREIPVEIYLAPFWSGQGLRVVASVRDLSETRRLERGSQRAQVALQLRATQLERSRAEVDYFLAVLGHELRDPITSLELGIGMLQHGGGVSSELEALMSRQVGQLKRLADDLLDTSRIGRGKLQLTIAPTDLSAVVRSSVAMMRHAADEKQQALKVEIPEQLQIEGDGARLQQVVNNLVSNAIKYTPREGIIRVMAVASGAEAILSVSDNGRGIPHDQVESIFERFTQLDRQSEGLGVGLPLVRDLVGLHGGTVQVESAGPGQGSTFTVRLPYSAGEGSPGRLRWRGS